MRNIPMHHKSISILLVLATPVVVWVAIAMLRPPVSQAQKPPSPDFMKFGIVHLGPGQTARLNALYAGDDTGAQKSVELTLFHFSGNILEKSEGKVEATRLFHSTEVTYNAGHGDIFKKYGSAIFAQVRGPDLRDVIANLEIMDRATGFTQLVLSSEVTYNAGIGISR